jgi:hypothetical protein
VILSTTQSGRSARLRHAIGTNTYGLLHFDISDKRASFAPINANEVLRYSEDAEQMPSNCKNV